MMYTMIVRLLIVKNNMTRYKFNDLPEYFSFKHRYLLFALDSEVMLGLLVAIQNHHNVQLDLLNSRGGKTRHTEVVALLQKSI